MQPVTGSKSLSPEWAKLFKRLSGRRAHIGLSRLARYASARGIKPGDINDDVIVGFIAAVRNGSLHRQPNRLHRQVTLIWNEVAAREPGLGLQPVTVASFRGPPKRIDWSLLPAAFRQDVDNYLSWGSRVRSICARRSFAASGAGDPAIAPRSDPRRRVRFGGMRHQSGQHPFARRSRHPNNLKTILRRRLERVGGEENSFNHNLGTRAPSDCARMGQGRSPCSCRT